MNPLKPQVQSSPGRLFLCGVLIAAGCAGSGTIEPQLADDKMPVDAVQQSALLTPSKSETATTRFEKLPASRTGIDFVHQWAPRDEYEKMFLKTGFTGGGVCVGDYDNDGLCDIYFTRPHGGGRLYRNLGDFQFIDTTLAAGVATDLSWTTGATFVDINNDGWLDLYVCAYASANHLFLNDGQGAFNDMTDSTGLGSHGAGL